MSKLCQLLEAVCDYGISNESRRSCCDSKTENITTQTSANRHPADKRDFSLLMTFLALEIVAGLKIFQKGRKGFVLQVAHHILLGCSF